MARIKAVRDNAARRRRVTAIAGLFYILLIIGNGAVASWYAAIHEMPWVALGVGLLALVALVMTVRIIKGQIAPDREG